MKRKSLTTLLASVLGVFAVNPVSFAGCSPSAILGDWAGTITVVNVPNTSTSFSSNYSSYCTINIKMRKPRTVSTSGSCTALSSNPALNGRVDYLTASNLVVARDCSVMGTVTSALGGTTEVHGHLNGSRNTFVAAFQNTTGGVGSMNFVK